MKENCLLSNKCNILLKSSSTLTGNNTPILLHCLVAATLDTLLPSRMRYVTFLSLSSWLHALDYPSLALSLSRSLASSPAFPLALGLSLGLGPANINNNGDNKRSMNEDDDPLSSVSVARAL